jgi:hypothetical protein
LDERSGEGTEVGDEVGRVEGKGCGGNREGGGGRMRMGDSILQLADAT